MSNADKIRMALAYKKKSAAWLAREIGTTPQNLSQRMKTDKFSVDELTQIAAALGAVYTAVFEFPDGTRI